MGKMILSEYSDNTKNSPNIVDTKAKSTTSSLVSKNIDSTAISAIKQASVDVALAATCPPLELVSLGIQSISSISIALAQMNENIKIAEEQTKQVKAKCHKEIRKAEEQTKQISIKELEQTKRTYMECQTKIQLAEIELENIKEKIEIRKSEILNDKVAYDNSLKMLQEQIDIAIQIIKQLSCSSIIENFEHINKSFQTLTEINNQIVTLYKEHSKQLSSSIGG